MIDGKDIVFHDTYGNPNPFSGISDPYEGFDLQAYYGEVNRYLKKARSGIGK